MMILILLAMSVGAVSAAEPWTGLQTGVASWYGPGFTRTASGERYDPASLTAAHRSLPFGTMVTVKNLRTGKMVTLRINNRGPYTKGRVIDVSKKAAQLLGMIGSGIAKVEITVLK
jgi:rare lipoprotein A